MRILIAGGGTGGHLFPGIAVAQAFLQEYPQAELLFVGSPFGIEARMVPNLGYALKLLPVAGLRGKGLKSLIEAGWRIPYSVLKALWIVASFRPSAAISCGGYAAGPAVFAAWVLRVPCFVLEQNAVPGMTNRILSRFARKVLASLPIPGFAESKVVVTGNPVRAEMLTVREHDQSEGDVGVLRILIFGGSQGARVLNETMPLVLKELLDRKVEIQIWHQAGRNQADGVRKVYDLAGGLVKVVDFIEDMSEAYGWAELVVCRAGATSIAELTVTGRPSVLIPFPFAVDDHQTANAMTLVEAGAALHLAQKDLSPEKLADLIEHLANDRSRLRNMAEASIRIGCPAAASKIVDEIKREIS
ncbi:MAG: undecaprenyldiphospho-muramoylpentapeptide beta-N-acetylglucosaminyltransferase [Myxococcota bacterium]|nr:undecaprenyldiphospho-muramoylpentapeptide beta-N-acetylglucosaminyltransferase [Myxococcota bacterium]